MRETTRRKFTIKGLFDEEPANPVSGTGSDENTMQVTRYK
jgi:hypothetical protein